MAPSDMWLTVDIGNSNIKGGVFDGARLVRTFRVPVQEITGPSDIAASLTRHLKGLNVAHAGVCSVVPALTPVVASILTQATGVEPLVIHTGMPLPFELAYETPHTLGADRLAAAVAGWILFGASAQLLRPVIVIDAGTAVTYEVIDRTAHYLGGAIAPGPALLLAALNQGTAQLPTVSLEIPENTVGRSTREAIQSGVMFGFVDSVRSMLERIRNSLNEEPCVVATGGWSTLLQAHISEIQHVEPDLVLHGIRILMERSS